VHPAGQIGGSDSTNASVSIQLIDQSWAEQQLPYLPVRMDCSPLPGKMTESDRPDGNGRKQQHAGRRYKSLFYR